MSVIVYLYVCVHVCMRVFMCVLLYVCVCVCVCVCVHVLLCNIDTVTAYNLYNCMHNTCLCYHA